MSFGNLRRNDPVAQTQDRLILNDEPRLSCANSTATTLSNANALVLVTEWKDFRSSDFEAITTSLKTPVIFNCRNHFDSVVLSQHGHRVFCVER